MYQSRLVEMAGGRPLGKDLKGGWVTVSAEQILKWDPEVILIPRYGWKDVKGPEAVKEDPRFKDVKAVKENKVWWFPSELTPWDWPTPQCPLGLIWLAKTLHPELFQNLDPLTEANKFYKEFYGHTFTELGGSL